MGNVDAKTAEEVGKQMGLKDKTLTQFIDILQKLAKITVEKEAELAEINPLAILGDDSVVALDGKVIIDDNAMFRHDELRKFQKSRNLKKEQKKAVFHL